MNSFGFIFVFLCMNIFGIILYWGTFFLSYFFSKVGKNYLFRDYYECGFKELPDVKMQMDISFSMIGLIFLVYEFEVILFLPIFINKTFFSKQSGGCLHQSNPCPTFTFNLRH